MLHLFDLCCPRATGLFQNRWLLWLLLLALPAGLATGVYVVRTGSRALRLTVE